MSLRLVSFDCAQTLVQVDWRPGQFAVECARLCGLDLDSQVASERYDRLLQTRWLEYLAINTRKEHDQCRAWWRELTASWMEVAGLPGQRLDALLEIADRRMYGPGATVFVPFEDALPTLQSLKHRGIKLAVVSNWDFSLHRVLETTGLAAMFDVVIASLEEGIEKPDPRVFSLALERAGVAAAEALHVGDDLLDDVQGARSAGMKAVLLDRSLRHRRKGMISSLRQIEEVLEEST